MSDLVKCRFCGCPIQRIDGYWIVIDPQTTADGLSYCPPNPDAPDDVELGDHEPPCGHSWVAGMMVVHPEDLDTVTRERARHGETVECEKCDEAYQPS